MRKTALLITACALPMLATSGFAAQQIIDQMNQKFSQESIALKIGDTLQFDNHDDVSHNINVINSDGDADDQGVQKPGENITVKFDKAGKFEVRCAIHPRMKMSVQVD
jgi:plastocyanin